MSVEDNKDRVFSRALSDVKAFEFNETVAGVFQDMISRSVPGYALLLHMIGLYAGIFIQPGTRVFDLGCSLGEATLVIAERTETIDCKIIAVDSSMAMINKCEQLTVTPQKNKMVLRRYSSNRTQQCFDGGIKPDTPISTTRRETGITTENFSGSQPWRHPGVVGKSGVCKRD